MAPSLPPPAPSQAYMHASVLQGGYLGLPEHVMIQDGTPNTLHMVPSLSFLLRHSDTSKNVIFDLGLRKDWRAYPPAAVELMDKIFQGPVDVPVDVLDSLAQGGLGPNDVDAIVLSHVHFDHVGDPLLFPSAHFIVGADAEGLLEQGYMPGETEPAQEPLFQKDLFHGLRASFVSSADWPPIGPFPRAHDFFGDGSFYLIDAEGHLPGHLNALLRTSADGSWLYLGGDSAHDVRLVTGGREIAVYTNPLTGGAACLHRDIGAAKAHIERIKEVNRLEKVEVVLAHDVVWFEENKGKGVVFPGMIKPL